MSTDHDYIPKRDADFDDWQDHYMSVIAANGVAWGIPALNPDYVDLLAKQTDWVAKYAVGKKSADPTHPQVVAKQTSRHTYEPALRLFNKRYIASNGVITDTDRAELHITIVDHTRTRAAVPETAPAGHVEDIQRLYHKLRIEFAGTTTPGERPEGVRVTRVYRCISTEHNIIPHLTDFIYIGNTSNRSFVSDFTEDALNHTAYYYLQYENTHGEVGPVSEIFSEGVI